MRDRSVVVGRPSAHTHITRARDADERGEVERAPRDAALVRSASQTYTPTSDELETMNWPRPESKVR